MSQNHHQILENDGLPMERERERERERWYIKKPKQRNIEDKNNNKIIIYKIKKKTKRQLVIIDWKTKML